MKLEIRTSEPRILSSDVREGQLFFAEKVGSGGPGVFIKIDGALWPILNGIKGAPGSRYSSPDCSVFGFEPIMFEIN